MSLRLFFYAMVGAGIVACSPNNQEITPNDIDKFNPETTGSQSPKGRAKFVDSVFMFGNINDGDVVQHTFRFTNVGKGPLTIASVSASCGCTTPEWTEEVIPPGGEGKVVATFDSKGRGGVDNPLVEKNIDVQFENAENPDMLLVFKANILSKESSHDNH
jgi:hypothetical protein